MSEPYFDLNKLRRDMSASYMHSEFLERVQLMKLDTLKELCGRLPEEGEAFFIETKKSFSAFTFIVYLIKHAGRIDHLYIATYSTNERIIKALINWRERGMLGTVHLHISETLKFRMPTVYQKLMALHEAGTISLTTAWTHKKITCMDTPAGKFVVEGSGNYGENALEEQYIFLRNPRVYDFHTGRVR